MGLKSRNVHWNPIAFVGETQQQGVCGSSALPSFRKKKKKKRKKEKHWGKKKKNNNTWGKFLSSCALFSSVFSQVLLLSWAES